MSGDARTGELAENLAVVEARIVEACRRAGRSRDEVTLVVVTKFFPAEDVARLSSLGVRDVGENKAQEATAKVAELDDAVRDALRIHFIGQLQTNKARQVAELADVVHAVDRAKLVRALDRAAEGRSGPLDVLVQVDLDPAAAHVDGVAEGAPGGRGGAVPQDVPALADAVVACDHLRLRGVMAVAPLDGDADAAFARLAEVSALLRERHPEATVISAGMSGDLEAAVAHGATHLRVGSAILGRRPAPR